MRFVSIWNGIDGRQILAANSGLQAKRRPRSMGLLEDDVPTHNNDML
jgi:hypothetical protein